MIPDFSGEMFSIRDMEVIASNGMIHRQMLDVLRQGEERMDNGSG